MARMPAARWLGEHGSRTMDRYDIVCIHTIVGFAPAHAAHFSTHADGTIDQSRDTRFRSAANLNGNHRVIAIENEDHGGPFPRWNVNDGHAVPSLTDAQVQACARILAWAHRQHGVPLQLCPDSRPGSRGLAFHRQGIDGNWDGYRYRGRVSGGEVWTSSRGKVCPGDRRIDQLPEILRRARVIVGLEDEVTKDDIKAIVEALEPKVRTIVREELAAERERDREHAWPFRTGADPQTLQEHVSVLRRQSARRVGDAGKASGSHPSTADQPD